jgi:hypothetical protein
MNYRGKHRGNSKIKFEHALIPGLRKFLESIEDWPEIDAINPGEIRPARALGRFRFKIQYRTHSGFKCLAQAHTGAVQEVFLVTSSPEMLETRLRELQG